jgi:hypothetical protein
MDSLFAAIDFFATVPGILLIGAVAVVMILLWDWRASLVGLFLIQLGVADIAVVLQQVDAQWAATQTLIVLLCCVILGLSASQTAGNAAFQQAGSLLLRFLVLILLYVCWRLFEFNLTIPLIRPEVTVLFSWLGICALVTLSLNDNPFFTGTALLQWFIPAQVVTAVLLPIPSLIVTLGVLQLLLALGCSYLMLVERYGHVAQPVVATDVTFPWQSLPAPSHGGRLLPGAVAGDYTQTQEAIVVPALPDKRPPRKAAPGERTERTGEHPLVARMNKRKSTGGRADSGAASPPLNSPPETSRSGESSA